RFYPHPSPLPKGEGTRVLAPFSLGRRVGEGFAPLREEGISYLHSAMPEVVLNSAVGNLDRSLAELIEPESLIEYNKKSTSSGI
ncbi:MAG: hypothetical protein LH660_21530, partial [Phormidesmis sp. CAN_BIN36]|nr:hypothetical protein [Phormidesmis sp. CAN_BIN36]